jgi:hypothetical protein
VRLTRTGRVVISVAAARIRCVRVALRVDAAARVRVPAAGHLGGFVGVCIGRGGDGRERGKIRYLTLFSIVNAKLSEDKSKHAEKHGCPRRNVASTKLLPAETVVHKSAPKTLRSDPFF